MILCTMNLSVAVLEQDVAHTTVVTVGVLTIQQITKYSALVYEIRHTKQTTTQKVLHVRQWFVCPYRYFLPVAVPRVPCCINKQR